MAALAGSEAGRGTLPETGRNSSVVIIGGGIAGLAAALRIRSLDASCDVLIVESAAHVGGKIAGEVVDGCVLDGGADVCIGDKLRATHMFSTLDLKSRLVRVNPNRLPTYEFRDGRLQRAATSYAGELVTFRTGMRELVTTVCDAIQSVEVAVGVTAASVMRNASRWVVGLHDNEPLVADAVIVATPAQPAAALLRGAGHDLNELAKLQTPATMTVSMAWPVADVPVPLDGTGYLVTDPESRISACTWTSSKNPSHARAGLALLRGYIRGQCDEPASLMCEEVDRVLGITSAPLFTRVYEWPAGIPVYTDEHRAAVRTLDSNLARTPGLFIAGSAFHGVGIPDCIHSGERAASAAMAYLATLKSEEAA